MTFIGHLFCFVLFFAKDLRDLTMSRGPINSFHLKCVNLKRSHFYKELVLNAVLVFTSQYQHLKILSFARISYSSGYRSKMSRLSILGLC